MQADFYLVQQDKKNVVSSRQYTCIQICFGNEKNVKYRLLEYPDYADLAYSDFHLFQTNLNIFISGKPFPSHEVMALASHYKDRRIA